METSFLTAVIAAVSFFLFSYSVDTHVMLTLVLVNVQYLQNVVFKVAQMDKISPCQTPTIWWKIFAIANCYWGNNQSFSTSNSYWKSPGFSTWTEILQNLRIDWALRSLQNRKECTLEVNPEVLGWQLTLHLSFLFLICSFQYSFKKMRQQNKGVLILKKEVKVPVTH